MDEVLRQLREDGPPSPSSKFNSEKDTAATAERRSIAPTELTRLLRGDLDWITMRAINRDRSLRYGTPTELAADIRCYLNNEPVLARPASTGYRLRKYIRRHRIGVAITAAAALLLIAFAVIQAIQLRRITRERDRANRITDFMTSMFKVSDPNQARGNTITAREVLDKASKDIETSLAKDPELQTQLMTIMGSVYNNLGLYRDSQGLLEPAAAIRLRLFGPKNPDTLLTNDELVGAYFGQGHYADAEKLARQTLELRRATLGPSNSNTLTSTRHLAETLVAEGHYPEAEELERDAFEIRRRSVGINSAGAADDISDLAFTLAREGRYPEAEQLDRQALDIRARILGPDHPDTMVSLTDLSWILSVEGNLAEAERLQRQALDLRTRVLGTQHPLTLGTMARLAVILENQARYSEAEALQRKVLLTAWRPL